MSITLAAGLKALGLSPDAARLERLRAFIGEIERWNPSCKLVAKGDDLVSRHVMDSLAGLEAIRSLEPERLADIGSGAGFPGIPLAIWMDHTEVCLIERSGRRAGFLRSVAVELGLSNVRVLEKTAEEAAGDGPFDVLTFRALAALDARLLKILTPLLAAKGWVAAYKGRREVVQAELSAVEHRLESLRIHPLEVPGLSKERCLVLFRPLRA